MTDKPQAKCDCYGTMGMHQPHCASVSTDKPQAEALRPYPCDALERLGLAIEAAMPSHIVLAPSQLNRMAEAALQVRATIEPSEAMVDTVAHILSEDGTAANWPHAIGLARAIIKALEMSRD